MSEQLTKAAREFLSRRGRNIDLRKTSDGYYIAPEDDQCDLCMYAKWVTPTGAHLKTVQHVARKYGVTVKDLKSAAESMRARTDPGDIAYKSLSVMINEDDRVYLVSPNQTRDDGSSDWVPHSVTFATCSFAHEVPHDQCGCGLYAYWNIEDAIAHGGDVVARIQIGGKIIEADRGCRAQAATVIGIYNTWVGHTPVRKVSVEKIAESFNVSLFADQDDGLEGYEIVKEEDSYE